MRRLVVIALFVSSVLTAGRAAAAPPAVTLLQWNVQNLFDAEDDPRNEGDNEYTPGAWRRWDERRYARKVGQLARVLCEARADIVALCEVENRAVLVALTAAVSAAGGPVYGHIAHRESGDRRGIDVAVLSRFPVLGTNWFFAVAGHREVVVAELAPHGRPLVVVANHWKSRYGGRAQTEHTRIEEARSVRAEVTRRLALDPRAAIVVLGDFNDDVTDPSLREALGARVLDAALPAADRADVLLFNLHGLLPVESRGTYYYGKEKVWNSFDSVSVTRGMLPDAPAPAPWRVTPEAYAVLRFDYLLGEGGRPHDFRLVTDPQTRRRLYQEGFSDHLPVRVVLAAPLP